MNYYRCENPDCGFLAEEEPDVCPQWRHLPPVRDDHRLR